MTPSSSSVGSSRRKLGQPTVCLECYLRKVKCDRKRPCSTCVRRGTQHLCKTFDTSQLDPETLQKKQARRSLAEINAIREATKSDHSDDTDPQQPAGALQDAPEHPMMAFINMLKDLNVQQEFHSSDHASPESSSTGTTSFPSSHMSRYLERTCLAKIVDFCAIVPEWTHLHLLLRQYLWNVDWKFIITSQDLLEVQMKDLWLRVILPAQAYNHRADPATASGLSLRTGDLSRLALLASVLGETLESMDTDSIAQHMPASRSSASLPGQIKLESDNARVRALGLLIYHIQALIEECSRLDEMTIDLVQANISAFSVWSNQGLHGTTGDFPRWTVTIRAAKTCCLFEDPGKDATLSQFELDHRRRLAWLVYGYDHAFAVGANTRPLIVESQFSVDGPSDAVPWTACGAPPDPCLALLEVQGGKIAQLVSNTLCFGPPLHRKAMETDSQIVAMMSQVHPSYNADTPDLSFDTRDPFRARRRCWLALTTAWQRGSLHRQFFFSNGRITEGELATSRHIATDSALRSIYTVRELRKMQNRFCDSMGSAWWFQYLTEPCMTLATAALLLIRSKGQGVSGLATGPNCWPTMNHFVKIIDECLQDLQNSARDPSVCLPSFVNFAQGCLKLIHQLRSAVKTSLEALMKAEPDMANLQSFTFDQDILPMLHPRSRQKSPSTQPNASAQGSSTSSSSSSSSAGAGAQTQGHKRASGVTKPEPSTHRSRKRTASKEYDFGSQSCGVGTGVQHRAASPEALSISPRRSTPLSAQISSIVSCGNAVPSAGGYAVGGVYGADAAAVAAAVDGGSFSHTTTCAPSERVLVEDDLPSGTLTLSFGPSLGFGDSMTAPSVAVSEAGAGTGTSGMAGVSSLEPAPPMLVAAPLYGVPSVVSERHLLSPTEPFVLRDFYTDDDDGAAGASDARAMADWLASAQSS